MIWKQNECYINLRVGQENRVRKITQLKRVICSIYSDTFSHVRRLLCLYTGCRTSLACVFRVLLAGPIYFCEANFKDFVLTWVVSEMSAIPLIFRRVISLENYLYYNPGCGILKYLCFWPQKLFEYAACKIQLNEGCCTRK